MNDVGYFKFRGFRSGTNYITGCHPKYSFLLHCGDDCGDEALPGHGGLDDAGVLPAGFVGNPEVVVDHRLTVSRVGPRYPIEYSSFISQ